MGKKRKVGAECQSFKDKQTNEFFFEKVKGKSVCLVCGDVSAVMKTQTLERNYSKTETCKTECAERTSAHG